MGQYGRLFRGVLYPSYEKGLCKRKTLDYLTEFEKTQWLSPEALRDRQVHQLRDLFTHCYAHVPYYRELFREINFDPATFESLEQLSALPVLTRDTIRETPR